jgi:hypothetical protein
VQEIVSLEDFVNNPTNGMHVYTDKLSQFLTAAAADGAPACTMPGEGQQSEFAVSQESLVAAVKELGLPRYIFSGVQQVITPVLASISSNLPHN